MTEINKKNAIWWVKHFCDDFAEHAYKRGYKNQAMEVESVRDFVIKAIKAYKVDGLPFDDLGDDET